jgi:hypothetical protein
MCLHSCGPGVRRFEDAEELSVLMDGDQNNQMRTLRGVYGSSSTFGIRHPERCAYICILVGQGQALVRREECRETIQLNQMWMLFHIYDAACLFNCLQNDRCVCFHTKSVAGIAGILSNLRQSFSRFYLSFCNWLSSSKPRPQVMSKQIAR